MDLVIALNQLAHVINVLLFKVLDLLFFLLYVFATQVDINGIELLLHVLHVVFRVML